MRPGDGGPGERVHAEPPSVERRLVVIALERHRAARDVSPDRLEDGARISAVADVVAEEDVGVGPHPPGMVEAGVERLAVAVDVAQEREEHGAPE